MTYRDKYILKDRLTESSRILKKYTNRIPVIVEKDQRSKNIPNINRNKYLVPNDLSMGQFIYVIRKRLQLKPEISIYLFVDNKNLIPSSKLISAVYEMYKHEDNFLYITYAGENTFG